MAGIETLYRFPVYQTRDAYKAATGKEPPPYNPNLPVKSWADPNPPAADEFGDVYYLGLALAADGRTPAVKDDLPYLRRFRIKAEQAGVVNIPVKKFDGTVQDPGSVSALAALDVPFPCRDLLPEEELRFGFGATVHVHSKSTLAPVDSGTGIVADSETKALLVSINSKLDVLLAKSRM